MSGAFPHQHGDRRSLSERIDAQVRERIQEAVELAALELMVERRRRQGRPAPETDSAADRREFEAGTHDLLTHLQSAFATDLSPEQRLELERVESDEPEAHRLLAGQVLLARRLPDYWQRFERYRADHAREVVEAPAVKTSRLGRLFGA